MPPHCAVARRMALSFLIGAGAIGGSAAAETTAGGTAALDVFLGVAILACAAAASRVIARNRRDILRISATLQGSIERLNTEIARRERVERELIAANRKAQEAADLKSAFLTTISHELRTPMNGILGFAKLLLDGDLTDEQRERIAIIDQSGEALLGLINDILDLSRIEAGKLELAREPVDLRGAAEYALRLLQARAAEKGLTLALSVDPKLPQRIEGDEQRLRQVLVNLVGNAIKFTDAGAVCIFITFRPDVETVRVSVIDTGIGIAGDKLGLLFERFAQLDDASTRKYGGTGLGLAICKEFIDLMGGEIGVNSIPANGSEFWFSAPARPCEGPVANAPAPAPATPADILIIHDVPLMREALSATVHALGHRASAARILEEARRLHAPVFAAVIVDAAMAGDAAGAIAAGDFGPDATLISINRPAGTVFDGEAPTILDQPVTEAGLAAALAGAERRQPATKRPVREEPARSAAVATPAGRVLIVDDHPVNRALIRAFLEPMGLSTDEAENGEEGLRAAAGAVYDLILMDIAMPVLDGADAAAAIRAGDGPNRHTPIIALTAHAMPGDRERLLAGAIDDYLVKPVKVSDLRAAVSRHIDAGAGRARILGEGTAPRAAASA